MRHKKKSEPPKSPERKALEKHVDAMMDLKKPDAAQTGEAAPETAPGVDSQTAPTAPQLSAKLRKQIGIKDQPSEPLHIKKLDELTESIAGPEPPQDKSDDEPAPEPSEELPEQDIEARSTELDDAATDKAVDDIVAYEGDVMLAVADSTSKARNQELEEDEPKGHPLLSTLFWAVIILVVTLIVILAALFALGGNFAQKLGI